MLPLSAARAPVPCPADWSWWAKLGPEGRGKHCSHWQSLVWPQSLALWCPRPTGLGDLPPPQPQWLWEGASSSRGGGEVLNEGSGERLSPSGGWGCSAWAGIWALFFAQAPGIWLQPRYSLFWIPGCVFSRRRSLCDVCGSFCPAAAVSLTCIPVRGGCTCFTAYLNHAQVTWALSGLSRLCGHPRKREPSSAMCLQLRGKDRALGAASARPGAAGTHPQQQAGTSSPAGTLFPCQPHARRNPGCFSCLQTGNCPAQGILQGMVQAGVTVQLWH